MTVLVCGGRGYKDRAFLFEMLDILGPDKVIHGSAPGADTLAEEWAKSRQVPYEGHPARWTAEGRSAGPRRNRRMWAAANMREPVDLVVAFPGGAGTDDMVKVAEHAGVPVLRY